MNSFVSFKPALSTQTARQTYVMEVSALLVYMKKPTPMDKMAQLTPALLLTLQLTVMSLQRLVIMKNVSENNRHLPNLITVLLSLKLALEANVRQPAAQLETWVLVVLKLMERELLESATRQTVNVKNAKEETQYTTETQFTTTALDSTTSAICTLMKQSSLMEMHLP
jgi:hypothetical protein